MNTLSLKKSIAAGLVSGAMTLALASTAQAVETERQLELSSDGLKSFFIDSGAGSLEITGEKDLNKIIVDAAIEVDGVDNDEAEKWFKKHMKLSLTEKDGKATLQALFETNNSIFSFSNWTGERKIDLVVRMPEHLKLEVDDGSGDTSISNINAALEVDDGSGTLTINNIGGDTWVDDGSGDLYINHVTGDLVVDDGSGSLTIKDISGAVEIEDGSGSIDIREIGQKVYIDDGSGSINACDIKGDLTIDDGSGDVDTCNITGEVVVK
ncbi:MAG: hypothetical protein HWD86_00985 [Kangiellaceae bacterium]|nr:hypothetical protein [Kangiellaceae bacterium]